mgnify:CR=1 FL=1
MNIYKAFKIAIAAAREMTGNDSMYDDTTGESLSFAEAEEILQSGPACDSDSGEQGDRA